ncbi:hypothetical protein CRENBAI_011510 [Crenichthys baileyi]|uniref:Uncharacterized protein n=1 Tax=Crenichthys baileyi TaxID=28760 RepID=A0AAV9SLL5_9TELE
MAERGRVFGIVHNGFNVEGVSPQTGAVQGLPPIFAAFLSGESHFKFEIFSGESNTSSRLSGCGYVVPDGAEDLPQVPLLVLSPACATPLSTLLHLLPPLSLTYTLISCN